MVEAVERRLAGESLRCLWDEFDENQKFAVSEVLYGVDGGFNPDRFKAKYGSLPAGWSPRTSYQNMSLRLFLHPVDRYPDSPLIIPSDLAERLLAFVPPPPLS